MPIRLSDIADGQSSTIAMTEVVCYDGTRRSIGAIASNVPGLRDNPAECYTTGDGDEYKPDVQIRLTPDGKASRGGNWADGAVVFIVDSIHTGNLEAASVYEKETQSTEASPQVPESPYGIWGALGTRAGTVDVVEALTMD